MSRSVEDLVDDLQDDDVTDLPKFVETATVVTVLMGVLLQNRFMGTFEREHTIARFIDVLRETASDDGEEELRTRWRKKNAEASTGKKVRRTT